MHEQGGNSFAKLELAGIDVAGFALTERREELEGPNSQIHLTAPDEQGRRCLVKLVDPAAMSPQDLAALEQSDGSYQRFLDSLGPEEGLCFVRCRVMGRLPPEPGVHDGLLYRVSDFVEGARYLGDPSLDAALVRPGALQATFARLCRAFALLERAGMTGAWTSPVDLVFEPQPDGGVLPRVVHYGSRFVTDRHRGIQRAGPSLQALWRIHPDLERDNRPSAGSAVFTLGALYYRFLAGRLPYHQPSLTVVTEDEIRPLSDAPCAFEKLLARMLSIDADARPDLDEVAALLQEPGTAALLVRLCRADDPARPRTPALRRPPLNWRSIRIGLKALALFLEFRGPRMLRWLVRHPDDPAGMDLGSRAGRRFAAACSSLGPVFIKLGQVVASRNDLFPEGFCRELSRLQDKADATLSFEEVRGRLLELWRCDDLSQECIEFEVTPIGSASIGQVYRARLVDGTEVVVKVRKPGVSELVDSDFAVLHRLVRLAGALSSRVRGFRLPELVEQLERAVRSEIVFRTELLNIREVEANFTDVPQVVVPTVSPKLSGPGVLVMGYLDGTSLTKEEALPPAEQDRQQLLETFIDAFLKMILVDGVFHADPHDGNLFVLPGNRIGLVDFGMVGRLSPRRRFELLHFLLAIVHNQPDRAVRSLKLMGAIDSDRPTEALEDEVAMILRELHLQDTGQTGLASAVAGLFRLIPTYRIRIPADVTLVLKALGTFESSVMRLVPGSNLAAHLQASLQRILGAGAKEQLDGRLKDIGNRYALTTGMESLLMMRSAAERLLGPNSRWNRPHPAFVRAASLVPAGLLLGMGLAFLALAGDGGGLQAPGWITFGLGVVLAVVGLVRR